MSDLVRANKVTVNVTESGFKADFYRTHKHIRTVTSDEVDGLLEIPEGVTKSGARELFRAYVIKNASDFGVDWNPADMRTEGNVRKASYATDDELVDDAMNMLLPQMQALTNKCKYPVEWKGLSHEDIEPMDKTAKGTDLSALGITDGKYNKSGKWAWAWIGFTATLGYKSDEIYIPVKMELVSGQLKKPNLGITVFNETVKMEILDAGLATEEELDPPKESKKTKAEPKSDVQTEETADDTEPITEEVQEEPVTVSVEVEEPVEEKPKKRRSRGKKKDAEEAK